MKVQNRRSVNDELKKYCYLANKHSDFIEVTSWTNEEGVDIFINSNGQGKFISLTYGELDAINYLVKTLDYDKGGNTENN